jgi:hypothetical protein
VRQQERDQQESDQSHVSDAATINTQGKNLNTSEMSTRNIFNAAECGRLIRLQDNGANYYHDNLIEI